jgi:NDP-sugar pyrophosphorylase family protein
VYIRLRSLITSLLPKDNTSSVGRKTRAEIHHINAGKYVIEPSAFNILTKNKHRHMPELLVEIINRDEKGVVFPAHEYWLNVGHPEILAKANGEW